MDISDNHAGLLDCLDAILSVVPVGITVMDATGKIVLCNDDAKRIFARDLIDVNVSELIPANLGETHSAYIHEFMKGSSARRMGQDKNIYGLRSDGTQVSVDVGLRPFEIQGQKYVFTSIVDISQQKEIESRLEMSNLELSQFAYVTSHDLKGPLTTIKGLTNFMEEDLAEGNHSEVLSSIIRVKAMASKLESLVISILKRAQAAHQERPFELVNIKDVVDDVIEHSQGMSWELGVSLVVDVEPCQCMGSHERLYEVLENLVSNGLKYCNPNQEQKFVSIAARDEGCSIVLEVEDNGLGIPEEHHDDVFTMFRRFHSNNIEGSGLGMAIVEKHVKQMNGEITFSSTPTGTCFKLVLPKH